MHACRCALGTAVSNYCRALEQLETFFQPPELNEREEQGLIKAFETSFELAWNTLRDLLSSEGVADLIGSRAMGRHRRGSDIDLCVEGPRLSHAERLELMGSIDDLLLPWQVDLSLWDEVNGALREHVQRVGLPLLTPRSRSAPASDPL